MLPYIFTGLSTTSKLCSQTPIIGPKVMLCGNSTYTYSTKCWKYLHNGDNKLRRPNSGYLTVLLTHVYLVLILL